MISFDTEKFLENFLVEHMDHYREFFGINDAEIHQQMNIGAYGITDIVTIRHHELDYGYNEPDLVTMVDITIFELKNTPLSAQHVSQISRYKRFFDKISEETGLQVNIRGVLIGKKTFPTSDDLCYLCQAIDWLEVYEVDLDPLKGLRFKAIEGWRPAAHCDKFIVSAASAIFPDVEIGEREPEVSSGGVSFLAKYREAAS